MRSRLLLTLCLAGCAATYRPPVAPQTDFVRHVTAPKGNVFRAAKQALALAGYSIADSDLDAGTITTSPRQLRLNADQCDCGTTLGLPYIKDKRTVTTLSMAVLIADGSITVRPDIHGEYLKNVSVEQSIAFNCVSKGLLEQELFTGIMRQLSAQ